MPNLSGTDWNSYTQQTQQGGGKSQTPDMFKSMTSSLGQQSGNTAGSGVALPGGTSATVPGSSTTGGVSASQPTGLTSQPASGSLAGTGSAAPGSFTVPGLGMVPNLDDFRSFMSYSSPTQQNLKGLMTSAGIFDQFAPYLQRDAETSPWALNALGAYGPQGSTVPLGGANGTPFDGYNPSQLMTLLQQHGIASNYTDPTAQQQPTGVPTSQPPGNGVVNGPAPTAVQQATARRADNAAQNTALSAATGGVAGGSAAARDAESRRQNLGGQAAFQQAGQGIAAGQNDPFASAGLPSIYASQGYISPTQNQGAHNNYSADGSFIGYTDANGNQFDKNGVWLNKPADPAPTGIDEEQRAPYDRAPQPGGVHDPNVAPGLKPGENLGGPQFTGQQPAGGETILANGVIWRPGDSLPPGYVMGPGGVPQQGPGLASGAYGANGILGLEDMGNPGLSDTDQLSLAMQSLYGNPKDISAFNNASNWAAQTGRQQEIIDFLNSIGAGQDVVNAWQNDTFGPNADPNNTHRPMYRPDGRPSMMFNPSTGQMEEVLYNQ